MRRMAKAAMRELVIAVGGNLRPTENRKGWLARVARLAGLSPRVVRAAWQNEQASRETRNKLQLAAAKNELQALADLAELLRHGDADFFSQDIAGLVHTLRKARGLDSP
jgi:hypothetical protein